MDSFIGEVRIMGFGYAPEGWAQCNGQIMSVQQNPALYSIIGNSFGGTPGQTFQLPNFQGQAPVGDGTGTGLTPRVLGEGYGTPSVQLTQSEIPSHTHSWTGALAPAADTGAVPSSQTYLSHGFNKAVTPNVAIPNFIQASPSTLMSPAAVSVYGGGAAHENRQPYLTLNFCISLDGEYPNFG